MPETCIICQDELRDAADLLLLRGYEYRQIARKLERPREWADALKWHLFQKHVVGPSKENYTILLVDYLQEAKRMLTRELEKPDKDQRISIIALTHKATQWAIQGYCRMEGIGFGERKKISADVIEALNQLANGNPEAVKRIAEARKKEKPILIEAKVVEDGTSPGPKV